MIGVIATPDQRAAVEEFFQLFKTPWEYVREGEEYDVVIANGREIGTAKLLICLSGAGDHRARLRTDQHSMPLYRARTNNPSVRQEDAGDTRLIYLDYSLWSEVEYLLRVGQPIEEAQVPTLDLHIDLLRTWILQCGLELIEIPPVPAGYSFAAAVTHDIDFVGIRRHKFDHTLAGYLYRSTAGSLGDFVRGRLTLSKLYRRCKALAQLPLIHLGLAKDYWLPFEWYLRVERGIAATYYFIPFKQVPGAKLNAANGKRRGCAYDVGDIREWVAKLRDNDCEIGVHGIDAWHSAERGRAELQRVAGVAGRLCRGIRMHWLMQDSETPRVLEQAGYEYDSTVGYNDTVGYRAGTAQVYRPLGNRELLELPMHIQDGALFFPQKLALNDSEAWAICSKLIEQTQKLGGALTLLWHDRSHGPERFWGEFYERLIAELRRANVWLSSAEKVVQWFRKRRGINFENAGLAAGTTRDGEAIEPPLTIRFHKPGGTREDVSWDGRGPMPRARGDRARVETLTPAGA